MLKIAIFKDDPRVFFVLTDDPKAPVLENAQEYDVEEVAGEVADRIASRENYERRRLPVKVIDLTGEANDDWLKGDRSDLELVYG